MSETQTSYQAKNQRETIKEEDLDQFIKIIEINQKAIVDSIDFLKTSSNKSKTVNNIKKKGKGSKLNQESELNTQNKIQNLDDRLMQLEYLDGSNAQIFTFLDTQQDTLYAMKYVANLKEDGKEFEKNIDVYHQEIKILDIIKDKNIENTIAKEIYHNQENVCIWMEQGQINLEKFSIERVSNKDYWQDDELINLTLILIDFCQQFFQAGLYHNDIKPANIVLQKIFGTNYQYKFKFIDLGGSCLVEESNKNYASSKTPLYMDNRIINKCLGWCSCDQFTQLECIQGELYQVGRTIIFLIQNCIDKTDNSNEFSNTKAYHQKFFNQFSLSQENNKFKLIITILKNLIRYESFEGYLTFEDAQLDIKRISQENQIQITDIIDEEKFDDLHIFNFNQKRIYKIYKDQIEVKIFSYQIKFPKFSNLKKNFFLYELTYNQINKYLIEIPNY